MEKKQHVYPNEHADRRRYRFRTWRQVIESDQLPDYNYCVQNSGVLRAPSLF